MNKLTIVSVDNFQQAFGNSDYAIFTTKTESGSYLPTAVSYNALRSRGININLLDNLVGSTLIANNDTDVQTGLVTSGSDRIKGIVDGTALNPKTGKPITILLLNKANSSIIKSELYSSETKDFAATIQAKVEVEEKKEKALVSKQRSADRLAAAARATPVVTVAETADLEVNEEDVPF